MTLDDMEAQRHAGHVLEQIEPGKRIGWIETNVPGRLHDLVWRHINLDYAWRYVAEGASEAERNARLARFPAGTRETVERMANESGRRG